MTGAATALVASVLAASSGCGVGVGPYQPRRDGFATAGGARPDLRFDEHERRAAHQAAKQLTLPERGGGQTAMYAFDGGYYVGVKQGASQTRAGDGPWSSSTYAFELHAGFFESVLADHLVVGTSLFAVGYGTGNASQMIGGRYVGVGLELAAKVGITRSLALRAGGGRMHGQATVDDGMTEEDAPAGAWRAAAGLDWVIGRLHGNDLVLTAELQQARTAEVALLGQPRSIDARALLFELVLVGI